MVNPLLFLPPAVSFLVTYFLTPQWIKAAKKIKLVGKDMNKYSKPEVAEMGGIAVIAGFVAGILIYIAINTFYFNLGMHLIYILAALSTVMIISMVGIIDDILGWKVGLKQWQKPLLTLPASFPMVAVNAGQSSMSLPFFGNVDFGIAYPLLVVPLGIVGAANGFNMLAGYNGLEAGMGIIILATLAFVAMKVNLGWVAIISLCMLFALLAFLKYNWYPAKVFPGDTLTYGAGALIACVAILGNMEKIAVFLFIPYFLDFLLPLRKKMKVEAFAKVNQDNSLEMPYGNDYRKIYDMAHLAIYLLKKVKSRVYERDVVLFLLFIEAIIAIIVILPLL